MILAKPQSYLTVANLKDMALDYDISTYSDDQLASMLVRASAVAESMMHKSYLATECTQQYEGTGNNRLDLARKPLAYVKKIELAIPGTVGWTLRLDQVLIDYPNGRLKIFQPLLWAGSYYALFPWKATIEVTFAHGYGYTVQPPAVTLADAMGGSLAPGDYDVAVTSQTPWGETTASLQTVTCSNGSLYATVTPVLGALVYRAFAAPTGVTPLMFVGESQHTAYGEAQIGINITSMNTPTGFYRDTFPTLDTSAHPIPAALAEATRLIFLSAVYEMNNLANRGLTATRSGAKATTWRSTSGNSGKGTPVLMDQARALLMNYATLTVL
jgi:hypothetical protein